jgi:murein DD-endopeptidase MepM/ murein hydrolase activator NlpD
VSVKVGDAVSQGTSLGKSGSSLLNPSENHVYFIVRKDSKTINPLNVFGKTLEELNG